MGNLISGMIGKVLAGQVRTLLAVGGGYLISKGVDAEAISGLQACLGEPVMGMVLWGVAGLWSAKSKESPVAAIQGNAQAGQVFVTEPVLPINKYPN